MEEPPPLIDESSDEAPPPLTDCSSDEESLGVSFSTISSVRPGWRPQTERGRLRGSCPDTPPQLSPATGASRYVHGSGSDYARNISSWTIPHFGLAQHDSNQMEQAARFVLLKMRQMTSLHAWDHIDFVRMADEAATCERSWKPLAILLQAQREAFTFRSNKEPTGHRRYSRGADATVMGSKDLGILRHMRDSRLVPFRLNCDCLYDHPGLNRLLKSDSPEGFPRLMHINPSTRGPVFLTNGAGSFVPFAVAFAGAEFVVTGQPVSNGELHWEVTLKVENSSLSRDGAENKRASLAGMEGMPGNHPVRATHESVAFVPVWLEGKRTLIGGQAPTDVDRFKAWHLDPRYHAFTNHIWAMEDVNLFISINRFFFIAGPLLSAVFQQWSTWRRIVCVVVPILLVLEIFIVKKTFITIYRSPLGRPLVLLIRRVVTLYRRISVVVKAMDSVLRMVFLTTLTVSCALTPNKAAAAGAWIGSLFMKMIMCILGAAITASEFMWAAALARLPAARVLVLPVRLVKEIIQAIFLVVYILFSAITKLFRCWLHFHAPTEFEMLETRYRCLLRRNNASSWVDFMTLARGLILDMRRFEDVASDRREHAMHRGARRCRGERGEGPLGCKAALAIAAVRQDRSATQEEKAAVWRLLSKSGMVRDTLVRTARYRLCTSDEAAATEDVAHDLMHAAQAGLTWPDELYVGRALQAEGKNPNATNVAWHRAKWVAIGARLIVERESQPFNERESWFQEPLVGRGDDDFDYRVCKVPPFERCVGCFVDGWESLAKHQRTSARSKHMSMDGRSSPPMDPNGRSACSGAVVLDARRRRVGPNYVIEDDCSCQVPMDEYSHRVPEADIFPFYHAEARRLEFSRQYMAKVKARADEMNMLAARLHRADKRAEKRRRSQQQLERQRQERQLRLQNRASSVAPTPKEGSTREKVKTNRARDRGEDQARRREQAREHQRAREEQHRVRMAAQDERRERRARAREQRGSEAEAIRVQRMRDLARRMGAVVSANDEQAEDSEEKETTVPDTKGSQSCVGPADGASLAREVAVADLVSEDEEDEESLCIVCMTSERNACLVHGRTSHQIVCLPCGDRLKKAKMSCPTCARPIDAVIQNFT